MISLGASIPIATYVVCGKEFAEYAEETLKAAVDVIIAVAKMVEKDPLAINELDINPLMLLAEGKGVVAADALISLNKK